MDVYADLDDFDFSKRLKELQEENDVVQAKMIMVAKDYQKLKMVNEELMKKNENLETNISTLFKTATAEIARKDRMIKELRTELDKSKVKQEIIPKDQVKIEPKTNGYIPTTINNTNQTNVQINRSNINDNITNKKQFINNIIEKPHFHERIELRQNDFHDFGSSRSENDKSSQKPDFHNSGYMNKEHRTNENILSNFNHSKCDFSSSRHNNDERNYHRNKYNDEKHYRRQSPSRGRSPLRNRRSPYRNEESKKKRSRSKSIDRNLNKNSRHYSYDRNRDRR